MDSSLVPNELEILWRAAGRKTAGEHATRLGSKFEEMRPRLLAMMLELVILELEQDLPAVCLSQDEIAVLLSSLDGRVRLLGIRLLSYRSDCRP
jgi:hypothetical protein